ncbi:hypothetical protein BX600DRAFT_450904 [Xylariales sp. PMI_506]|nr:hypothetical protein BX600DRAFT_450904 [Xylariales sp. PMI_506]
MLTINLLDQLLIPPMPSTGELSLTASSSTILTPIVASSSSSSASPDQSPEPGLAQLDPMGQRNPRKRSPPMDPETALKRQRNNIAARKYRQKKIDRISELEAELKDVKDERDDLRVRLARQEAEAAALRSLLKIKAGVEI